jgi:membrane protein DedA with SNARE-associated domain
MSHHLLDLLRNALVQYGYWGLALTLLLENAGVPVPGETILLMASFLAYSERELQLVWVIVIGTMAATIGDNLGYALGAFGGRPMLRRYQSVFRIQEKTILRGEDMFARYGPSTIFFARFVFGMRIVAGPLAGVLRMPWRRFLIFNFLGAAVWVTVISTVGYLFGRHWERLAAGLKRLDAAIAIVVLLIAAIWWWKNRRRDGREHPGS